METLNQATRVTGTIIKKASKDFNSQGWSWTLSEDVMPSETIEDVQKRIKQTLEGWTDQTPTLRDTLPNHAPTKDEPYKPVAKGGDYVLKFTDHAGKTVKKLEEECQLEGLYNWARKKLKEPSDRPRYAMEHFVKNAEAFLKEIGRPPQFDEADKFGL